MINDDLATDACRDYSVLVPVLGQRDTASNTPLSVDQGMLMWVFMNQLFIRIVDSSVTGLLEAVLVLSGLHSVEECVAVHQVSRPPRNVTAGKTDLREH